MRYELGMDEFEGVSSENAGSTFCPRLWSSAFIVENGDVYGCCHYQPYKLGNIHQKSLKDIWNDASVQRARAQSLNGKLACYAHCNLLDEAARKARPTADQGLATPYDNLRRLKILFGELCNIACIMCWQDHKARHQLSLDVIKQRVDFTNIDKIEFQGGEPLAIKECKNAYLWLTEEMGKKVNFLTNGTLVSEAWAERICKGSKWLHISFNGARQKTVERVNSGVKYQKVLQSVERLLEARQRLKSKVRLVGHFTIVPENVREIAHFPEFCAELGLDGVEYGYDRDTVPKWIRENAREVDDIRRAVKDIVSRPPLDINTNRLIHLGIH
ncbi:radical SAM protein [Hoeflea sp.]|uniref:radical SAM protein n=1 Tax=Hoeflea sp. TaxID=1940281 RepID=UPI003B015719